MFGGPDIGAWLVLALGAAMAVGHLAALLNPGRPRSPSPPGTGEATARDRSADRRRAPLGRSLLFIGVGLVAAIWALASLLS